MKVEKVLVIKTTSEKRILLEGSVGFDDAGAEAARHTRGHMERSRQWSVTLYTVHHYTNHLVRIPQISLFHRFTPATIRFPVT